MTTRDDISKSTEAEDAALMELLYAEVDTPSELHDELNDSDELEGLRGMRALFAELPEEEPSAALHNKLMAAAAEHAPKQEKEGFFAFLRNLWQPIALHPAAASLATLVLVAGVAGTLYVTGQVREASEPVMPESSAQAAKNEADESAPVVGTSGDDAPKEESKEEAAEGSFEFNNQKLADEKAAANQGEARRGRLAPVAKRPKRDAVQGARRAPTRPAPTTGSRQMGGSGAFYKDGVSRGTKLEIASDDAPPAPPRKPKARPKTKPEPKPSEAPELTETEESSKKKQQAGLSQLPSLLAQAKRAAKKGDCAAVKRLGQKVKAISAKAFDEQFLADRGIRTCYQASKLPQSL